MTAPSSKPEPSMYARAGLVAYGATLVALTSFPSRETSDLVCYWSLMCGQRGLADIVVNVLMFVPLGVLLERAGLAPPRFRLLLPFLCSAALEALQLAAPGRHPSAGDILFNGIGGMLGIWLSVWLRDLPNLTAERSTWLSTVAGIVAALVTVGVAVGFRASLPRSEYWGQWTPVLSHLEVYRGTVLEVGIDTIPIPTHKVEDSRSVRDALVRRRPISARIVTGPRTDALASIVSIADGSEREIVLLGADREEFVYRSRMVATELRLDQPDFRVPWRPSAGDTVTLGVGFGDTGVTINQNGHVLGTSTLTVGRGWALLYYPAHLTTGVRKILDGFWIAFLIFPFAFFFVPRGGPVAAGAVLVLTLGTVPIVTTLEMTGLVEWVGLSAGLATGLAARRVLARKGATHLDRAG